MSVLGPRSHRFRSRDRRAPRRGARPAANGLEMIASENFARSVLQSQGSVLTNKYAEGYPGRRYYGGCEEVDVSGRWRSIGSRRSSARNSRTSSHIRAQRPTRRSCTPTVARRHPPRALARLRRPPHARDEDQLLGQAVRVVAYGVSRETPSWTWTRCGAREHRPKFIIAGWSAYPRQLDFARFREIADEVGAYLMVDMAHFAGLVAAGLHPSPVPHAHVVTSTTHKTLGGPRGGFILTNDADIAKKINSAVFPGQQGGPLEHVIAAKAVAFKMAAAAEFEERHRDASTARRSSPNGSVSRMSGMPASRSSPAAPTCTWSWSTCATRRSTASRQRTGLATIGITVNRNAVPFDPRPPMVTSGLRIGTPALAARGSGKDFAPSPTDRTVPDRRAGHGHRQAGPGGR